MNWTALKIGAAVLPCMSCVVLRCLVLCCQEGELSEGSLEVTRSEAQFEAGSPERILTCNTHVHSDLLPMHFAYTPLRQLHY